MSWRQVVTEYAPFAPTVRVGEQNIPATFAVDAEGDHVVAHLRFQLSDDGVPRCRQVLVEAVGDGVVGVTDLRTIRLTDWAEAAIRSMAFAWDAEGRYQQDAAQTPDTVRRVRQQSRRSREARVLSDDFLAQVADVYRAHPDRPTAAVAEHFGKQHRTAAHYVNRARHRGHLGATTAGRKGEATPGDPRTTDDVRPVKVQRKATAERGGADDEGTGR